MNMNDRNFRRIEEAAKKLGNDVCAECGSQKPEWGSYNIGIFLCTTCATFHRKLGCHISKIKSLQLDTWDDQQVEKLEYFGNNSAKEKYEQFVPACYRRPKPGDPLVLLEQWVFAKYQRMDFCKNAPPSFMNGYQEGFLQLKKRRDDSYTTKKFILSESDYTLKIYNKEESKEKDPKIVVSIGDLSVCLAPPKLNIDYSMQFSFICDGGTRHLFICHENGETIVHWYMAIRNLKLNRLLVAYPSSKEKELVPYLTKDFAMEGYLSKTGPSESDAYRKRWFTLDDRKLMYHGNPMDDTPRGEIFLGYKEDNYRVQEGVPKGCKEQGFAFCLYTPYRNRTFVFSASSSDERSSWIEAIRRVLDRPLRPQDNQCKVALETGKKRTSRQSWFTF